MEEGGRKVGGATMSCSQAHCWRISILYASNKYVLLAYRQVHTPVTKEGGTGPPGRHNIAGGRFFLYASNMNMLLAYKSLVRQQHSALRGPATIAGVRNTCTPATCPCHWRTFFLVRQQQNDAGVQGCRCASKGKSAISLSLASTRPIGRLNFSWYNSGWRCSYIVNFWTMCASELYSTWKAAKSLIGLARPNAARIDCFFLS